MKIAAVLLGILLMPHPVAAQSTTPSENSAADEPDDLPLPSWSKAVIDAFDKPLHPVIGGVASGGGLGFGIAYDSPDKQRWYQEIEGMLTIRRNWSVQADVGRRSLSDRSQIGVFGEVRHMNRIEFFGLGPAARFDDRTSFRLREATGGARGWFRPAAAVRIGGTAGIYLPDLGAGAHPSVPSVERVFAEPLRLSFSDEPVFGRYRAFVEYRYPAPVSIESLEASNHYRSAYQLALEVVRDYDSGRHNFHRWEAAVQQVLPGLIEGQRLTLHGFLATTNEGSDVPFYMLYTLGGAGGLKSFRPDLFGADGTRATLRGFRSYRFRDRDLVLMQAEYRIPLHDRVHATVFVDSGQVAPRPSLLFKDLRTSTGFSLSYMRRGKAVARIDVGMGGGEGIHVSWTFGAFDF